MIYPIILCGGSGTRLWPLSRKSYPKQFSRIIGDHTLFQASCMRFHHDGFAKPVIVTDERFRFTILDELEDIQLSANDIILEPSGKNTAPAVLAAILEIRKKQKDAKVLILPADHAVQDIAAFTQAVQSAASAMGQEEIVTFGVQPTRPDTGYGYLELTQNSQDSPLKELQSFREKPDHATAESMLASGNFLWNAGVFLGNADWFVQEYQRLQGELYAATEQAMDNASQDLAFTRPDAQSWQALPDISIDYAIMEKTQNIKVMPIDIGWSDLGNWKAVWENSPQDENANAVSESAYAIDCQNALLRSEREDLALVGIGLENIFAVAMNDAVVIGHMDRAQDVKLAVDKLKANGHKQASEFPKDHRPWGWYETLALGDRFQVKRIVVKPGASLSLQSHVHRSEHWTVVEGSAKITIDGRVELLGENQSIYVPLGAVHRMENPGKIPLTLIEVQSGPYLGEDDIIRYEDSFGRK